MSVLHESAFELGLGLVLLGVTLTKLVPALRQLPLKVVANRLELARNVPFDDVAAEFAAVPVQEVKMLLRRRRRIPAHPVHD